MQISAFNEYYDKLTTVEKKNSPKELFYKGDFSLLENGRRVAVVGSRKVSELGVRRARKIAKLLVQNDITAVSGLAEGVDSIAHRTAIEFDGHTIGVIGTPLDKYFPAENKDLQDFIAENHLLISQFPENYPVTPKSFPIRNRTMALIRDAAIIIEASEKSGTKHQGWEALRLGRQLLIMDKHYGSGADGYIQGSSNYFDINAFVNGGNTSYFNERRNSFNQGQGNPISGARFSWWDIGVPILTPFVLSITPHL